MKAAVQGIVLVAGFLAAWFLLAQIDFIGVFKLAQFTRNQEQAIGSFILRSVQAGSDEVHADTVRRCIDTIVHRLCRANGIPDTSVRVYVIVKDEVNAFAIPDRQIIVTSAIISFCKTPDELAGVVAHELAHIELHHVTKKLVKDVGFTMLSAIAGGEAGGEVGRSIVKMLSSTAFDRTQESEADRTAVHMLAAANADPEGLADLLFRISQEKDALPRQLVWLQTHPDAGDRAAEILHLRKAETFHAVPFVDTLTWGAVQRITRSSRSSSR